MEKIFGKRKLLSPIKIPGFTATELSAAEQLVHLSESSAESSLETLQRSLSSALSSSSSPISVGSIARPPPYRRLLRFSVAEDAGDDDGDAGFERPRERYRSIAEIYGDCVRIGGDGRRWAAAEAVAINKRRKREGWD